MSPWRKIWPFRPSRAETDADRLLSAITQISRQPSFYGPDRVPDTLEGRFELMTLHAALALIRLKVEAGAEPLAQDFTDKLFRQFDGGLREAGVGDLSVPKRMRKLAGSFYGRLDAYSDPLAKEDRAALGDALVRNMTAQAFAPALAAYAFEAKSGQAAAPVQNLMRLDGWPTAPV
jgi:cytochrome b pre-mRNA-processing protein 3